MSSLNALICSQHLLGGHCASNSSAIIIREPIKEKISFLLPFMYKFYHKFDLKFGTFIFTPSFLKFFFNKSQNLHKVKSSNCLVKIF